MKLDQWYMCRFSHICSFIYLLVNLNNDLKILNGRGMCNYSSHSPSKETGLGLVQVLSFIIWFYPHYVNHEYTLDDQKVGNARLHFFYIRMSWALEYNQLSHPYLLNRVIFNLYSQSQKLEMRKVTSSRNTISESLFMILIWGFQFPYENNFIPSMYIDLMNLFSYQNWKSPLDNALTHTQSKTIRKSYWN